MIALVTALVFVTTPRGTTLMNPTTPPVHAIDTFRFQLAAPLGRVAPLFGPEGERCWAGKHWNPQFLHPQPARDTEGAVFTVPQLPQPASGDILS